MLIEIFIMDPDYYSKHIYLYFQALDRSFARFVAKDSAKLRRYADTRLSILLKSLTNVEHVGRPLIEVRRLTRI